MADNGTHEIAFVLSTQGGEKVVQTFQQINVQYNQLAQQNNVLMQQQNKVNMSQRQSINNTNNFVKAEKNVGKEASSLSSMFGTLGKVIAVAFSVSVIKDFTKSCLELGSALTEVQNVVDVVFGKNNNYIENFAQSSLKQFGLMEVSAKKYAGLFGAMAKNSGFDDEQSEAMATQLASMVGDVASFYDMDKEQAFTALMSIFSNNTASLRRSTGIVATQANLQEYASQNGIEKQIKDMTNAEKVALRYSYVMEKLAFAQGDFQRTSGTWANQMRLLKGEWEQFKTVLGQILIEVLLPLLKGLNELIQYLVTATSKLKDFIFTFRGMSDSGITEEAANARAAALVAADSMDEYADSIDGVTSSAEKLKKASFGFDNLNKLADPKSGSGSGSGMPLNIGDLLGGDGNPFENVNPIENVELDTTDWTTALETPFTSLINFIESKFNVDVSDNMEHLAGSMDKWGKENGEKVGKIFSHGFQAATKVGNIGDSLIEGVGEVIDEHLPELEQKGQEMHDNLTTPVLDGVDETIQHTNDKLDEFTQDKLPETVQDVQDDVDSGLNVFDETWNKFVTPNLETLHEDIDHSFGEDGAFQTGIDRTIVNIQRLVESLGWVMDILGLLGGLFSALIVNILDIGLAAVSMIWQWINDIVQAFVGAFEIVEGVFDIFKGDVAVGVAEISDGLLKILMGIADWVMQAVILIGKVLQTVCNDIINAYNSTIGELTGSKMANATWANDFEGWWNGVNTSVISSMNDYVDEAQTTDISNADFFKSVLTGNENQSFNSSYNQSQYDKFGNRTSSTNSDRNPYYLNINATLEVDGNEFARAVNDADNRYSLMMGNGEIPAEQRYR